MPVLAGGAVLAFIVAAIIAKNSVSLDAHEALNQESPSNKVAGLAQRQPAPAQSPKVVTVNDEPLSLGGKETTALTPKPARHQTLGAVQALKETLPSMVSTPEPTLVMPREEELSPLAQLQMLESYVDAGSYREALQYAQSHRLDDGYYHFLRGRALHKSESYAAAEEALNAAQTTPSNYARDIKRQSTYLWAQNRLAIYHKKPNVGNRKIALTAWQNYQQAFCKAKGGVGECGEAEGIIEELER